MKVPSEQLRETIAKQSAELRNLTDEDAENGIDKLLGQIYEELIIELKEFPPERDVESPNEIVAACHAWVSLVSHALVEVYAPSSPFPRNMAGWGNKAISRIQQFTNTLRTPLDIAKKKLGASSYSIGVAFPWGVSISFAW